MTPNVILSLKQGNLAQLRLMHDLKKLPAYFTLPVACQKKKEKKKDASNYLNHQAELSYFYLQMSLETEKIIASDN